MRPGASARMRAEEAAVQAPDPLVGPGHAPWWRLPWRLFDDDGRFGSKITVNGSCDPDTHQAIVAAADNVFDGGIV
jgi:hypothetical protein